MAAGPTGPAAPGRALPAAAGASHRGGGIEAEHVFAARTAPLERCGPDASAVDEQLDSLRHRWNQFGLEALIRARAAAGAVVVHYRLTVSPPHSSPDVHAAFRGDLTRTLGALGAPAPPASWDLADMAPTAGAPTPAVVLFEADLDYHWEH